MITVLDLQSGHPRLTVDAGMEIGSLGMTANTIVAVGEGKIVNWKFPAENCAPSARANVEDSVKTTTIDLPQFRDQEDVRMSMSSDLRRVAVAAWYPMDPTPALRIYDLSTGKCLVHASTIGI